MKDDLGTRMKEQYESRSRTFLPRRTYTIIRLDGKAFHTYTKNCNRPFDWNLIFAMDMTTVALCHSIQGSVFGYTQSDEISLLLTDFNTIKTDAWFNGQVQKIVSIAASAATLQFNTERLDQLKLGLITPEQHKAPALFDARVFTIPDPTEVANYFIWRQKDAARNSLQMLAQNYFSPKKLHGKSQIEIHDMLHGININWNNHPQHLKRGRLAIKKTNEDGHNHWVAFAPQIWTQSTQLQELIPTIGDKND